MRLLWLLTLWAPTICYAETLIGRVVGVTDGDTIIVIDQANQQHKIRLGGIDAPEKTQPFGERSKQDRYGRTVGKVMVNGVDTNLEQIKAGMAWWYEKYRKEQSDADQHAYSAQEAKARHERKGLWRDADPVPPWEWRKLSRENRY